MASLLSDSHWLKSSIPNCLELLLEVGRQVRERLAGLAGGVAEQVAEQAFGHGVVRQLLADRQRVQEEATCTRRYSASIRPEE